MYGLFVNGSNYGNMKRFIRDRVSSSQSRKLKDHQTIMAEGLLLESPTQGRFQYQSRPAYLRAMTMPPERPKITATDQTLRSASFQSQQHNRLSGHVHPKVPDYDDLVAKFTALKKVHLQTSILQVGNA